MVKNNRAQYILGGTVCRGIGGPVYCGMSGTLSRGITGPVCAESPIDKNLEVIIIKINSIKDSSLTFNFR